MEFPNLYKGNYKLLALVPLLLIALSLYFIPQIKLGVEFTGGTLVTFVSTDDLTRQDVVDALATKGLSGDVKITDTTRGQSVEITLPQDSSFAGAEQLKEQFSALSLQVENLSYAASIDPALQSELISKSGELNAVADEMFLLAGTSDKADDFGDITLLRASFMRAYTAVYSNYQNSITAPLSQRFGYGQLSIKTISPTLSVHFLETAVNVVVVSIILSVILVFVLFRTFVPSLAVILGALSDVLIALGAMGFFGIPFTLPSFAALLMLIGFSLDTDILLTMRILKREGNPRDLAHDAMKTGTTMSIMAIVAFGVLFILASLTNIPTYFEISSVALAGLVGDLVATWGINAVLLLMYVERRSHG